MKKYYKIYHGFNVEDYIEINEEELEKAYYCFLKKLDSVFSGGAVRGARIESIKPDFHRIMGWNRGYKLVEDDFAQIRQKGIDVKLRNQQNETERKVKYLIATKQEDLIGKGFKIPELKSGNSEEVKKLSDKFKI